ncbi:hypothetical protein [Bacillus niameyensis]|uniref:hypothetical protein n=1 Tax=Bacillus niameyensis TaxID=1522308 RepID=UPI00078510E2|nr:hypothetical protein [Bacillus niameyensis]
MKKFSLVLLISFSLLFAGCNYHGANNIDKDDQKKVERNTEMEDNQIEIGRIDAEIEVFEFKEAVAKSDLIAQIEVIEIFKEINEPFPKTIFRANLIESLKGSFKEKEIFVMQQGNSDYVFNDNPLFKKGESYLLFLMKTKDFDIENSYWILGEEAGMYKLLDQSVAVKLSVKEDELKNIEISDEEIVPFIQKNTELNMNEREMQVLKQDELINLIKTVSEE